jgi:hypothetical protein
LGRQRRKDLVKKDELFLIIAWVKAEDKNGKW